ncbi:MAG: hypothetical protein DCC49_12265 [Acidobacteria bacterium]|nr:MAG: hypothetical protein DCC49_12265 [Acidobacteriota bacterium]
MPEEQVAHESEVVPEDVVTAPLDDLAPPAGVAEAVELYEAAVREYTTAVAHQMPTHRVSSTSSRQAARFG